MPHSQSPLVACFDHHLALEGHPISRAMAEERMLQKLTRSLTEDIEPLLPVGAHFNQAHAIDAFNRIWTRLIARLHGDGWKLSADTNAQLRAKKYPQLLAGHHATIRAPTADCNQSAAARLRINKRDSYATSRS